MEDRKTHYNKVGMYAGYDKNNKAREELDYYSTPTEEVENILNTIGICFDDMTILEPCAGGGHMVKGISTYIKDCRNCTLIATDIMERGGEKILAGKEYDFISDNYPIKSGIDYIVMNPPYSLIEPFTMKSLGLADKGVLMLARLQFLEGEKRYDNIFQTNPPTDVYVYVDRISCYKNGDLTQKMSSAQAYAWFYWDFLKENQDSTQVHFIRRKDKSK